MKIVTVAQMRELERRAVESGVFEDSLMETAGLSVARRLAQITEGIRGKRIVVLVGSGNNGGDGMVAARYLADWGGLVTLYMTSGRRRDDKFEDCRARHVRVVEAIDDIGYLELASYVSLADVVIDAVLGIGNDRPLSDSLRVVFEEVARLKAEQPKLTYVALDVPSGLQADTGVIDDACFPATMTLTLGAPKVGLYAFPGAAYVGSVEVLNIGLPGEIDGDLSLELCDEAAVAGLVPNRPLDGHKGSFGDLLVVAGSRRFIGAPILATTAAYRAGAGLVTLAAPETASRLAGPGLAEQVHLPLPETPDGHAAAGAAGELRAAADRSAALVIGPGLGNVDSIRGLMQALLLTEPYLETPSVIDADALNALSQTYHWWESLKAPSVLTPHPGEMGRLLGQSVPHVQDDRVDTAQRAAVEWGQVVVLKGAHTVIASPDGRTAISPFANPALASAGTGDVLAGIIGALLAQGLAPYDAARLGVHVHAAAAENVSSWVGSSGLLASDLHAQIPVVMERLRRATS
ncbi:MAG: NAD(P)H-hydrate dehydratase [Chloroflexi bacterium]|nr:NAD(P)H-hydrate dehydratase [Chloroflexota bacterium]MDA1173770.1 NAD(P)H-hydrate dehydratase [Chloroflexota bacterium]